MVDLITFKRDGDSGPEETFIDRYVKYGWSVTDAPRQYHVAGGAIILSALICPHVTLPAQHTKIRPNLWAMILAGTAQPLDEPILTPHGWSTMGKLSVGDYVIGSNGQPTKVVGVYPQGTISNYLVKFSDGTSTRCSDNHLWTVKHTTGPTVTTMKLSDVMERMNQKTRPRIPPMTGPVEFTQTYVDVDPYLVGLWLAEGAKDKRQYYVDITGTELDYLKDKDGITFHPYSYGNRNGVYARGGTIRDYLRHHNLLDSYQWDRFIPEELIYTSWEDRLAVLGGLLDGDGSISSDGHIRISLTSERLIDDIVHVVRSLGGRATKIDCGDRNGTARRMWQSSISMPEGMNPFKNPRKKVQFKAKTRRWVSFESITQVSDEGMVCIQVEAKDSLYVTNDFILTHNTVTRKSTSMDLAVRTLGEVLPSEDYLMGTDGSPEGILTELQMRDGKASLFHRDEITGFIAAATHKEYNAGLLQALTSLYDGRQEKRTLRAGNIDVKKPRLIFWCGGIKSQMQEVLSIEHIRSGFIPRFIIVTGSTTSDQIRPIGPPVNFDEQETAKSKIINEMYQLVEFWMPRPKVQQMTMGAVTTMRTVMQGEREMQATPEAWDRMRWLTFDAVKLGENSSSPDIYTPMYVRLADSIIKLAVLLAGARQSLVLEFSDICQAIRLADVFLDSATEFAGAVEDAPDINPWEKKADKILKYMKTLQPQPLTKTDLMRRFHVKAKDIIDVEQTLLLRGQIKIVNNRGLTKNGTKAPRERVEYYLSEREPQERTTNDGTLRFTDRRTRQETSGSSVRGVPSP